MTVKSPARVQHAYTNNCSCSAAECPSQTTRIYIYSIYSNHIQPHVLAPLIVYDQKITRAKIYHSRVASISSDYGIVPRVHNFKISLEFIYLRRWYLVVLIL